MTAREQFSWVWLVILLATYIPYFGFVGWLSTEGEVSFVTNIVAFASATIAQIALIAVASAVIALRTGDPNKLDERDRAIAHRAANVAYHVLMAGVILVGCLMPFNHAAWEIFQAAVFAIALSEIVRLVLVVRAYRAGVHV
jgi:hypothetical protein